MNFFLLANLPLILLISLISLHQIPSWPFTILLLSFSSLFPFLLNNWLVPGGFAWRNHHVASPNLRGPTGWPILGSLPEMGNLAHRRLAQLATSLGASRVMAFSLGVTRVIISSHPDTAKEILSGPSFSDRPIKESARALMFERAIGFAPAEKYWRHLRRIAANHMFSPRKISSLEELRQRMADEMVAGVWKVAEEKGEVELRKILQRGSLRNILESVFGSCLCLEQEELLGLMVEEGYGLISEFNWEDHFPVRFLDFYGVKRRCNELAGKVKAVVGRIVEERKSVGAGEGGGNDFLSSLTSLPEEDKLSDSDMVAVLWVSPF